MKRLSFVEPLGFEDIESVNVPVEQGLAVRVTQPGVTRLAIVLIGEGTQTWR